MWWWRLIPLTSQRLAGNVARLLAWRPRFREKARPVPGQSRGPAGSAAWANTEQPRPLGFVPGPGRSLIPWEPLVQNLADALTTLSPDAGLSPLSGDRLLHHPGLWRALGVRTSARLGQMLSRVVGASVLHCRRRRQYESEQSVQGLPQPATCCGRLNRFATILGLCRWLVAPAHDHRLGHLFLRAPSPVLGGAFTGQFALETPPRRGLRAHGGRNDDQRQKRH